MTHEPSILASAWFCPTASIIRLSCRCERIRWDRILEAILNDRPNMYRRKATSFSRPFRIPLTNTPALSFMVSVPELRLELEASLTCMYLLIDGSSYRSRLHSSVNHILSRLVLEAEYYGTDILFLGNVRLTLREWHRVQTMFARSRVGIGSTASTC